MKSPYGYVHNFICKFWVSSSAGRDSGSKHLGLGNRKEIVLKSKNQEIKDSIGKSPEISRAIFGVDYRKTGTEIFW
jgi:hypothetical protein